MAEDFLGLRGFAQVVPDQPMGNLYSIGRLAMQGKQQEREFQAKQQETNLKAFSDASKGLFSGSVLRPHLQEMKQESLLGTYKAMEDLTRAGGPDAATSIISAKNNHDAFSARLDSIEKIGDTIQNLVNTDKTGQYNQSTIGGVLNDLDKKAVSRNDKGEVVINDELVSDISRILESPSAYNWNVRNKLWIDSQGEQKMSMFKETQDAYFSRTDIATNGIFETEVINGEPQFKRKPDGGFIVKATPESIALYIGEPGSVNDKYLIQQAEGLPKLKNGEPDKALAFKKFVAEPNAKAYEGETKVNEKSSFGMARTELQTLAKDRFWKQLVPAMFSKDKGERDSAIGSLANPEGGFKVEVKYVDPSNKAVSDEPAWNNQESIVTSKFINTGTWVKNPTTGISKIQTEPGWVQTGIIPIATDAEKIAAIQALNKELPDSPKDAEIYRKVISEQIEVFKKQRKIKEKLGVPWDVKK